MHMQVCHCQLSQSAEFAEKLLQIADMASTDIMADNIDNPSVVLESVVYISTNVSTVAALATSSDSVCSPADATARDRRFHLT